MIDFLIGLAVGAICGLALGILVGLRPFDETDDGLTDDLVWECDDDEDQNE